MLLLNENCDEEIWKILKIVKFEDLSKKGCTNGQINVDGQYRIGNQVDKVIDMLGITSPTAYPQKI